MMKNLFKKGGVYVGFFSPKNDDDYRRIAEKVGRGEHINSIDRADYERYKQQSGAVPRELRQIEENARKSSK